MIVLKGLDANGRSPYQHHPWPLPEGDAPGAWVEAGLRPIELCANGIHGCLPEQVGSLPGDRWFVAEIEGDVVSGTDKAAGRRGRLLREIPPEEIQRFALACASRAMRHASGALELAGLHALAESLRPHWRLRNRAAAKTAAWAAKVAAGAAARAAEKQWQGRWITKHWIREAR